MHWEPFAKEKCETTGLPVNTSTLVLYGEMGNGKSTMGNAIAKYLVKDVLGGKFTAKMSFSA